MSSPEDARDVQGLDREEGEPLDVDMSGSHGTPEGVAAVLKATGKAMTAMPDGARYDFELSITEVEPDAS